MAIERIKHEPTYITNKFEFYYDSYDDENRYSNYEFDYVREGVEYMIIYTTSKEEIYMDVIRNEAMVKVENPTIFDQYSIIQNSSRELYLKPYILVLTDIMRKKDSVIRYFAKSKLDKYDRIFEINKLDYNSEANFYDTVSLIWQLQGSKENILLNNTKILEKAEKIFEGIEDFLDPLEFYEEEMTPYEEIQEKLGRLQTGY